MSFFYIPVLFLILILLLQYTVKVKVFFNIKNNNGRLQLKFIGIKIIDYELSIKNRCLRLTNKKNKNKYLPLDFDSEAIENYNKFKEILFRKVYAKEIGIYFNFGIENNANITAMVTGFLDIISKIAYCILKTKKSEVNMILKTYANFNNSVIKFGLKAKISLSIFDLFWSFAESKTKELLIKKPKEKLDAREQ